MAIKRNWLYFLLGTLLISAFFHFRSPNIPDPDSLYHLRHAWLYRTGSMVDTGFPWTYYSVIRLLGADLWYGFHLFLTPFTYFGDLLFGNKAVGIFMTAGLLLIFGWILKRHQISLPFFWPFIFFFSVPNALFQLLMVRPHLLSLALSIALLSVLISGSWPAVFLLSALIVFFHLSFFWIAPGIAFLIFLLRIFHNHNWKLGLANFLWVIVGTALGALLRPEPLAALQLVYIQVVKLLVEKQSSLPLLFSRELAPLSFGTLFQTSFLFLILWVPAIFISVWALYRSRLIFSKIVPEVKIFLLGSGFLSLVFFLMSVFIARRSYIFWVAFGMIFSAGVYGYLLPKKSQNFGLMIIAIIFLLMVPYAIYKNDIGMRTAALPPDYLKAPALWLGDNSNPGDIVFNTHWDNFSALFFWNQTNYYIGGMDPIFQYVYKPELYWKFHHISKDEFGDLTCGEAVCGRSNTEDVYKVLKEDFKAKYILAEKRRNPNLLAFLNQDSRFEESFNNGKEMIFLLK